MLNIKKIFIIYSVIFFINCNSTESKTESLTETNETIFRQFNNIKKTFQEKMDSSNKQAREILVRKWNLEKEKDPKKIFSIYSEVIDNTNQDIANMKWYVNELKQLISQVNKENKLYFTIKKDLDHNENYIITLECRLPDLYKKQTEYKTETKESKNESINKKEKKEEVKSSGYLTTIFTKLLSFAISHSW